jgi:hypothetical protein
MKISMRAVHAIAGSVLTSVFASSAMATGDVPPTAIQYTGGKLILGAEVATIDMSYDSAQGRVIVTGNAQYVPLKPKSISCAGTRMLRVELDIAELATKTAREDGRPVPDSTYGLKEEIRNVLRAHGGVQHIAFPDSMPASPPPAREVLEQQALEMMADKMYDRYVAAVDRAVRQCHLSPH